jgi:hypothetical protein
MASLLDFILPLKTWSFGPPVRRAYASESQVRVFRLYLGVFSLKSQIPSTKLQINLPAIASSPASQARPACARGAADGGQARRGGQGHERAGLKFQYSTRGARSRARPVPVIPPPIISI